MSGPKYSTAYIRERQRLQQLAKELEEQIENSKRKELIDRIARLEKEKKACLKNTLIDSCNRILPEANELLAGSPLLKQFEETLLKIKYEQGTSCSTVGNSEILLRNYNIYNNNFQKLKANLLLLKELKKQLTVEGTEVFQKRKMDEFLSEKWEDTGETINAIPIDLQSLYFDVLEIMSELPDFEQQKKVIDETIMIAGDNEFKKRQLNLRKNALIVEKNSSRETLEILSLENELRSIYRLIGWEEKQIPTDKEELKSCISMSKQLLEQKQKTEYIVKCVHKVFEDRGYSLIEDSIVSTTNATMEKDYYEFGEDSMINVSMSDKGQMLFEVVGNGKKDQMDESRAIKLESEMRRFCPDYYEIKKALIEEYGISLEDEHLCKPDRKYAKAVDVNKNAGRRQKKTEKKMMYYDN